MKVIRAAGGVVWRPGPEVLLVHRPRYDDWSLPKGKVETGEHLLATAVREVYEESGVHAVPQLRLPSVRYPYRGTGLEKTVDYWTMRVRSDGGHRPGAEVDVREWLPVPTALARLSYPHDRDVLSAFAALPPVTGVVVLMRHGSAGRRTGWPGPDEERPLDDGGRRDARHAAALLALFAPTRVISAAPARCRQTVAPTAEALGLRLELDPRLAEGADVAGAVVALREIAGTGPAVVVCSQGGLMRPLVGVLRGTAPAPVDTRKGTGWVLSYAADGTLVDLYPIDPRVAAAD